MAITPLPSPPLPSDTTAEFNTKAFAWVAALDTFTTETNALASDVSDDADAAAASAVAADASADAAAASAVSAAASADAAENASNATKWVSGTTYAEGDVVWSPINYAAYRRISAGAGTTDPSADPVNWAKIAGDVSGPASSTNNGLVAFDGATGKLVKAANTVTVAQGGTGATSLTANNVLLGNGTSALQVVAPGTTGNVLTSNGTTWTSAAPSGGIEDAVLELVSEKIFSAVTTQGYALEMTSDIDLVILGNTSSTTGTGVYAFVYDKATDTYSSAAAIRTGTCGLFHVFKIDSTKALVVSCDATTGVEAVVVSISGTTISVGTAATVTLTSNRAATPATASGSAVVGSTYVSCWGTASSGVAIMPFTVSGTTVTAGTALYLSAGASAHGWAMAIDSSNLIVTACGATNTRLDVATYSVSGATLTLINTAAGTTAQATSIAPLYKLSSGRFAVYTGASGACYGHIISLDGSNNPSISTAQVFSVSMDATNIQCVVSGDSLLIAGRTTSDQLAVLLTHSSGTAAAGNTLTLGSSSSVIYPFNSALYIFSYGTGSSGANDQNTAITQKIINNSGSIKSETIQFSLTGASTVSVTLNGTGRIPRELMYTTSKLIVHRTYNEGIGPVLNSDDTIQIAKMPRFGGTSVIIPFVNQSTLDLPNGMKKKWTVTSFPDASRYTRWELT